MYTLTQKRRTLVVGPYPFGREWIINSAQKTMPGNINKIIKPNGPRGGQSKIYVCMCIHTKGSTQFAWLDFRRDTREKRCWKDVLLRWRKPAVTTMPRANVKSGHGQRGFYDLWQECSFVATWLKKCVSWATTSTSNICPKPDLWLCKQSCFRRS